MQMHIGFRVMAKHPITGYAEVENFEIKQAAIDCARLLAANGWTEIKCAITWDDGGVERLTPLAIGGTQC